MDKEKADMIIYTTEDGLTKVETTFDGDTVWLSIDQMAELFQRDKSIISRHIKNIFIEGELQRDSVVAKFATTASRANSPESKMFFRCREMPDLSTRNSSAIWLRVSQTLSLCSRTSSRGLWSSAW